LKYSTSTEIAATLLVSSNEAPEKFMTTTAQFMIIEKESR
jgi:hypothetical protein